MNATQRARKSRRGTAGARPLKERPQNIRPGVIRRAPLSVDNEGMRHVYTQLGFHSVRMASSDGRFSHGGSGDMHLRFNREQLANMAREFARDNCLFQGMIDRAAGYIVGRGFGLQAKTGDKDLNAAYEAYWNEFWEEPEVSGLFSGLEVEKLMAKELLTSGDFGVLKTKIFKIQIVENEQIKGKELKTDGLVRDENGVITHFWMAPYSESGNIQTSAARMIKRENFLFAVRTDRPSSKRGVPPLQAAFAMLHRIEDVLNAEALAWQQLARLAIIVNKKDAGIEALQTSQEDPDKAGSTEPDITTRIQNVPEGTFFYGEKDEEVRGVERNIPGANFPQSVTMYLRLMGLPLGLPLEITALDWTKSNYSQTRAVLQQAFQSFIGWQGILEKRVYRHLYRWCIERGIAEGTLTAPSDPSLTFKHEWLKPTFPWIDQLQETKAYGEMVDRGFATYTQVLKSRDKDREEVLEELKQETIDAIRIADEIEAETGRKVDHRGFCGRSASVNGGDELEAEAEEETEEAGEEKDEKKPPAPRKKKAARAGLPVLNVTVKEAPRPTKTRTRILSRDAATGKADDIEQEHTYPSEVA